MQMLDPGRRCRQHGIIAEDLNCTSMIADDDPAAEMDDAEMADALCDAAEDDANDQEQLQDAADRSGCGTGPGPPPAIPDQPAATTPLVCVLCGSTTLKSATAHDKLGVNRAAAGPIVSLMIPGCRLRYLCSYVTLCMHTACQILHHEGST